MYFQIVFKGIDNDTGNHVLMIVVNHVLMVNDYERKINNKKKYMPGDQTRNLWITSHALYRVLHKWSMVNNKINNIKKRKNNRNKKNRKGIAFTIVCNVTQY